MKRYMVILCMSLMLVAGIGFSFTLFTPEHTDSDIIYTTTVSENKKIQQRLEVLGYYKGDVDGIIGLTSLAAIKAFQKDNGLVADGVVNSKTLAALKINGSLSSAF